MDAFLIQIFLAIIGWWLFQSRRSKQRKSVQSVSLEMTTDILEEVPPAVSQEGKKKESMCTVKETKSEVKKTVQPVLQSGKEDSSYSAVPFRSVSDARRAFIYSEIFHRKYD